MSAASERKRFDLVVVGGGVAGLYGALAAAESADVLLLAKGPVAASNSWHAQGGIAAAVGEGDAPELHAADTQRAGRGLCRESAVAVLTREAPARIADLVSLGVEFDEGLGREGGHSRRRVVHAGGAETGKAISAVLAERVRRHPRIEIAEGERVRALVRRHGRCAGVATDRDTIEAGATLLATGGYAALWERTTNPPGALGEGLALAYRAGAALADLEFVQFHPTALLDDGFLLSEALRGEGALLLDGDGARFTDELAPRDVVARAIAERGQAGLDLRPIERGRFPGLMATLERAGYDPATEPIPVSPAAHYTVGGIVTGLDGATTLPGLYAAGECAATGVHGANRLASNSLLECLVFGRRAALASLAAPAAASSRPEPPTLPDAPVTPELRHVLWQDAGVIRGAEGLRRLLASPALVPRLVAESALARRESRGGHFRSDFPTEDAAFAGHVVLRPGSPPALERWS
jgi:L-aspartate oxidase